MAKKKVTVNIEEMVWFLFKKMALSSQLEAGQPLSVSQYLENMISVKLTLPIEARTDIEAQKDRKVYTTSEKPDIQLGVADRIRDNIEKSDGMDMTEEQLAEIQLKAVKREKAKTPGAIKTSDDVPVFNPQPKLKDKGK